MSENEKESCRELVRRERKGFWWGGSGVVTQQTTAYTKITFKIPFTKKTTIIIIIIIIINIIITILFESPLKLSERGNFSSAKQFQIKQKILI